MLALSIKNLTKVYKNGALALKAINLDVNEGDFFALLGPNGAGKTTLIGIINSLNQKTTGEVKIFNHDIDKDFTAAKRLLGVVPQEFNLNVFDRVEKVLVQQAGYYGVPPKIAMAQIEEYLKALDLWQKRHTEIRKLSGGMKRRVMIVRALLHRPKLLLLDEPSAGVDVELRHQMWKFIRTINQQGTTIILTTHYLEEAEELCKNLAIINHGEIIEKASMADLLRRQKLEVLILHSDNILPIDLSLSFAHRNVDSKTLEVEIPETQSINQLMAELTRHNIIVKSIENKMNRLENLFLTLTREQA